MCVHLDAGERFARGDERPEYGEQKTQSGEERFNEERLLTPFDFASTDLYEAFLALLPSV